MERQHTAEAVYSTHHPTLTPAQQQAQRNALRPSIRHRYAHGYFTIHSITGKDLALTPDTQNVVVHVRVADKAGDRVSNTRQQKRLATTALDIEYLTGDPYEMMTGNQAAAVQGLHPGATVTGDTVVFPASRDRPSLAVWVPGFSVDTGFAPVLFSKPVRVGPVIAYGTITFELWRTYRDNALGSADCVGFVELDADQLHLLREEQKESTRQWKQHVLGPQEHMVVSLKLSQYPQARVKAAGTISVDIGFDEDSAATKAMRRSLHTETLAKLADFEVDFIKPSGVVFGSKEDLLCHWASVGETDLVVDALRSGADINGQSYKGSTALIEACSTGSAPMVELLLNHGADPAVEVEDGTALWATRLANGDVPDIVRLLLERNPKNTDRSRLLCHAVAAGHDEVVRLLLDAGGDPNYTDPLDRTPLLHRAIGSRHATKEQQEAMVMALLANGADPLQRSPEGFDAIQYQKEGHNPGSQHESRRDVVWLRIRNHLLEAAGDEYDDAKQHDVQMKAWRRQTFRSESRLGLMPSSRSRQHGFSPTTFYCTTMCSYCKTILLGLSQQGLQCRFCNFVCHPQCQSLVDEPCPQCPTDWNHWFR